MGMRRTQGRISDPRQHTVLAMVRQKDLATTAPWLACLVQAVF